MTLALKSSMRSLAGRLSQTAKRAPIVVLPIGSIDPNPDQPRKHFDDATIAQLAESIRGGGILEPLIVRPVGLRHQIVAGERRWRAAIVAGLSEVPVVEREFSDDDAFAASLIENIEREDMVPLDEVQAVARLAAKTSVQEAAARLGKAPQWVSKRKRIADAPTFVLDFLASGGSADIEALYELAQFADDDPDGARSLVYVHGTREGSRLRDDVRAARRALMEPAHGSPDTDRDLSHANTPEVAEVERICSASSSGNMGRSDDRADQASGSDSPGPCRNDGDIRRASRGSVGARTDSDSAVALGDEVIVVEGVTHRGGQLILTTSHGLVSCKVTENAREQLLRILRNG